MPLPVAPMHKKPNAAVPGLMLFGLVGVLALILGMVQTTESAFSAWFALGYYMVLCWFVVRYYPAASVLLLWFIFVRFTTMISGVAIETGGYMPEMLITGYPTGGFARLAAVYTVAILGGVFMMNALMRLVPREEFAPPVTRLPWANMVFALVLLLCAWAALIGLKNGFPVFVGEDRVDYWRRADSRFLYFFLGNRSMFALLLGLVYAASLGKQKAVSIGIFIIMMVLSLLFAEKFTSICLMLIFFATPVFLRSDAHLKNLVNRLIPLGLIIAVITMPAVLVAYGFFEDSGTAIRGLQVRATSQAEIWFMEDQKPQQLFNADYPRMQYNISAMLSTQPDALAGSPPFLGAKDYMAEYLKSDRYKQYVDRGVTLTMATEAYLLKLFGWLGMIPPYLLLIFIYCAYEAYLYYAIITAHPVRMILAGKTLIWAIFGLNQGYFWFVFGLKQMFLIALIVLFELALRSGRLRSFLPARSHFPRLFTGFSKT